MGICISRVTYNSYEEENKISYKDRDVKIASEDQFTHSIDMNQDRIMLILHIRSKSEKKEVIGESIKVTIEDLEGKTKTIEITFLGKGLKKEGFEMEKRGDTVQIMLKGENACCFCFNL